MPPARSGAQVWSYRGVRMLGVMTRPAGPAGRRFPAVLFLHGMPGSEKNVDVARRLMSAGVASFSPHFRGAWGSEGRYRVGDLPEQARAALRFLCRQDFVDGRRLAVFGFSMGGWTALHVARLEPSLRAVVAVAPVGGPEMLRPETRATIARLSRPLRVSSADGLYRDFAAAVRRRDPAESAARRSCPLLLIHGGADHVVSPLVSERIYAAAASPKRLVRAPGADHDFLDRREWLSRLAAGWLERRLKP